MHSRYHEQLTEKDWQRIAYLFDNGVTITQLALRFQRSHECIRGGLSRWRSHRVWGERLNRLDPDDRQRIWLLRDEGQSLESIAKRFGVSIATVSRIVSDRRQRTNTKTLPIESHHEQEKLAVGPKVFPNPRAEKEARRGPTDRVQVQARAIRKS